MIRTCSGEAVLMAAISGRALAESARRGGYLPLVADFFCDQDTVAAAAAHVQIDGSFARGFRETELMTALERLAAQHAPIGVVCGTGFEDRPHMLAKLAQRWRLYGNDADKVAQVKDPELFAEICRRCDVPFPRISLQPPARDGFVAKRRGGSGGAHVSNHIVSNHIVSNHIANHLADASEREARDGIYYQARVPGRPMSALLLANGVSAIVLGFSAQWANPTPCQPFRYGGAVQPADIPPDVAMRLEKAACRLASGLSLTGLNSADFMVDGDDFWIVEINPRPGATLDIFEAAGSGAMAESHSLFALHMAACRGDLVDAAPRLAGAKASAICYAARDVTIPDGFAWPDWSADRPNGGLAISAGEPLCTVHAGAAVAVDAKALVEERLALIDTWVCGWTQNSEGGPDHEQHR
jgi:predicted ATP-grasp superfamily ATP-dependent carboligase